MSTARSYELVLRRVEDRLRAGRLKVGQRLPAERAFAEELGVSRASVREAIRVLEAMGVVRTGVGSGPGAGAVIVAEPSSPLTSALRLHVATSRFPVGDVVEARVLLETWAVRVAASRGGADLGPAEAAVREMDGIGVGGAGPDGREDPEDMVRFLRLDAAFHRHLAETAGNAVISSVMRALRGAVHSYLTDALTGALDAAGERAVLTGRLQEEHRGILAAVRAGRGEEAAETLAAHIRSYYGRSEAGRAAAGPAED